MKKSILLGLLALTASIAAQAQTTACSYNIVYHWGFIQKVAGHGVVTLDCRADTLQGTLRGQSIPWDGRVYAVSDTLHAVFTRDAATGAIAEHVLFEDGWYTKPQVGQTADLDNPADYRTILGQGTLNADASTMEAITITADMIGFFQIVKMLDFGSMTEGQLVKVPITMPAGAQKHVNIRYDGTNSDGLLQVTFNYTYNGTLSNYPVNTTIDPDTRTVVTVAADLEIGHLEMQLVR